MSSERKPVHLFFSYARQDRYLRDKLEDHLSILKYRGLITTWHNRDISAGSEWAEQIDIRLNSADIILLLISASFMASGYCYSVEMQHALKRHENQEARVIPILLRPVLYTEAPFAKLRCLPSNRTPVVKWRDRDSAFLDIALGIEELVHEPVDAPVPLPYYPRIHALIERPDRVFHYQITESREIPQLLQMTGQSSRPLRAYWIKTLVSLGVAISVTAFALNQEIPRLVGIITICLILMALFVINFYPLRKRSRTTERSEQGINQIARQSDEVLASLAEEAQRQQQRELQTMIEAEIATREERKQQRQTEYYEDALQAYEQALRDNPRDAVAYRGKGNVLYALGLFEEALKVFEQAVSIDPTATSHFDVGRALLKCHRDEEAVVNLEQAIDLDPAFALAYGELGDALRRLGRVEEAERAERIAEQLFDMP